MIEEEGKSHNQNLSSLRPKIQLKMFEYSVR